MRYLALLTIVLALASAPTGAQNPKPITGQTAVAVQSWVDAVRTHRPGRADAPVPKIASLTYADREELNAGLSFFFAGLLGWTYDTKGNAAAKEIVEIGHGAGNPTAVAFLKQAAVLHADAAAYGDRDADGTATVADPATDRVEVRSGMGRTTVSPGTAVSPLLHRGRLIIAHDGEVLGDVAASWNWPFARFLLDLLLTGRTETPTAGAERGRAADPFVSEWYHATTAYMLAAGTYGDLTAHLEHAAKLLPNDARVLFDRGCYAELFGLPMHQALVDDRNPAMAGYKADAPVWAYREPLLRIPPADRTNAEAERLFRRAAEADPALAEARVRLARLLQLRNRHREAADELKLALAGSPDDVTAFYGRLFAARSAQALGSASEAAAHYQEALRLFPHAQSALLGASQVALVDSDLAGALAAVARLGPQSSDSDADPWWRYHLGPGRDADNLLRAVWASVPR
jgi:tetratricopeptide (TPR) repeat protein